MKLYEDRIKLMQSLSKSTQVDESRRKSMKSMEINENNEHIFSGARSDGWVA